MKDSNLEAIFNMEEARSTLMGISDTCLLIAEQGPEITVTSAMMDFLGMTIRETCEKYLRPDLQSV